MPWWECRVLMEEYERQQRFEAGEERIDDIPISGDIGDMGDLGVQVEQIL